MQQRRESSRHDTDSCPCWHHGTRVHRNDMYAGNRLSLRHSCPNFARLAFSGLCICTSTAAPCLFPAFVKDLVNAYRSTTTTGGRALPLPSCTPPRSLLPPTPPANPSTSPSSPPRSGVSNSNNSRLTLAPSPRAASSPSTWSLLSYLSPSAPHYSSALPPSPRSIVALSTRTTRPVPRAPVPILARLSVPLSSPFPKPSRIHPISSIPLPTTTRTPACMPSRARTS